MPVRMVFRMTGSNFVHREFHRKGVGQPRNARLRRGEVRKIGGPTLLAP